MKIEFTDIFYDFETDTPPERIANISQLLFNYPVNYRVIGAYLYQAELEKLISDFPEFNFTISEDEPHYYTVYCEISRKLC